MPGFKKRIQHWIKLAPLALICGLLSDPLVRHDGPTTLQVTVNEQPDENRWIIHLLHYIPERRSQEIDIIEDVIPLYNVKISIRLPKIKDVMSVPEQESLPYEQKDGRVEFTVPQLVGHQMIALELSQTPATSSVQWRSPNHAES